MKKKRYKPNAWYKKMDYEVHYLNPSDYAFRVIEDRDEGGFFSRKRVFRIDLLKAWKGHTSSKIGELPENKIYFTLDEDNYPYIKYDDFVEVTDSEEIKILDRKLNDMMAEKKQEEIKAQKKRQLDKLDLMEALRK